MSQFLQNFLDIERQIIVPVLPIFMKKTVKNHDFDARGVWRLWILRKVFKKCLIPHFSCRAWKYESNGGLVDGLSAFFAEKNESTGEVCASSSSCYGVVTF